MTETQTTLRFRPVDTGVQILSTLDGMVRYSVPSSTGGSYGVVVLPDGQAACECLGWNYGHVCRHVKLVLGVREEEKGGVADSSKEAYVSLQDHLGTERMKIYNYLREHGPRSVYELSQEMGREKSSLSARLNALHFDYFIRRTDQPLVYRGKNMEPRGWQGRLAIIHCANPDLRVMDEVYKKKKEGES